MLKYEYELRFMAQYGNNTLRKAYREIVRANTLKEAVSKLQDEHFSNITVRSYERREI